MGTGPSFIEYVLRSDWRFLQEREIGLDLYHSGTLGIGVFVLAIVSATVFALALFQVIPRARHVTAILLGIGLAAGLLGLLAAYSNYSDLAERVEEIVSPEAGPHPVTVGQEAVVVALPMLLGTVVFAGNVVGCIYLALFWGGELLPRFRGEKSSSARGAQDASRRIGARG